MEAHLKRVNVTMQHEIIEQVVKALLPIIIVYFVRSRLYFNIYLYLKFKWVTVIHVSSA